MKFEDQPHIFSGLAEQGKEALDNFVFGKIQKAGPVEHGK